MQQFGRHVVRRAAECPRWLIRSACQPEVSNHRTMTAVVMLAKNDIGAFQISMDDPTVVRFRQRRAQLTDNLESRGGIELAFSFQMRRKSFPVKKLHAEKINFSGVRLCSVNLVNEADVGVTH